MLAANHSVWTFLIGCLLVVVLWLRLAYGYENGFDPSADVKTILTMIGAYFGSLGVQTLFQKKADK